MALLKKQSNQQKTTYANIWSSTNKNFNEVWGKMILKCLCGSQAQWHQFPSITTWGQSTENLADKDSSCITHCSLQGFCLHWPSQTCDLLHCLEIFQRLIHTFLLNFLCHFSLLPSAERCRKLFFDSLSYNITFTFKILTHILLYT
jgi:hypothetical protein